MNQVLPRATHNISASCTSVLTFNYITLCLVRAIFSSKSDQPNITNNAFGAFFRAKWLLSFLLNLTYPISHTKHIVPFSEQSDCQCPTETDPHLLHHPLVRQLQYRVTTSNNSLKTSFNVLQWNSYIQEFRDHAWLPSTPIRPPPIPYCALLAQEKLFLTQKGTFLAQRSPKKCANRNKS